MDDLSSRGVEPVPIEATGIEEIVVSVPDIPPQESPVIPAAPAGGALLGNVFEAAKLVEPEPKILSLPSVATASVPCYRDRLDEIRAMLVQNRSLALLFIDASHLAQVEHDYGGGIYEQVRDILQNLLLEMRGVETRRDDLVTVAENHGDVFLIFLTKKREDRPFGQGDLERMADRIHGYLTRRLSRMTSSYLKGRPRIGIGYGLVLHNPLIREDRLVLQLIEDAKRMAEVQEQRLWVKSKELLQEIILKEDVRTFFQPIIDLNTRATLGFEALTRGPAGTEYESPYMLFDVATESDLLFELDRLCRRNALTSASAMKPSHKLFVNLLPTTIRDPEFQGELMLSFLKERNLSPSRIVLEITERLIIENYDLFLEAMRTFTDQGFSIAIDDMGAGYSGLEKIVHLNPRYLKFDLMMVRDIDTSFVKREMLKAIHSLASNVGADVIAEGIERPEELETLLELGIPYGQGFLFVRPQTQLVEVPTMAQRAVAGVPGLIVD
jgi:EAL domain-containing protein (putative c-di-GMP-specific phosphodiesterase class I)/GGDEF domain-containing protein